MATVTYLGALNAGSQTAGGPYTTAAFTPPAGALIVCVIGLVGTSNTAPATEVVTSSAGLTFTDAGVVAVQTSNFNRGKFWISDQFATAVSQTFRLTLTAGTNWTGITFGVYAITGMSKNSAAAVKQTAKVDTLASGVAGTATFPSSCDTNNPMLYAGLGEDGGHIFPISDTTGWTANLNAAFTKPGARCSLNMRSGGFTGNSITCPSDNTRRCLLTIELDASASGPPPINCTLTATEAADTVSADGTVFYGVDDGQLTKTEAADTIAATAAVAVDANLTKAEANDTISAAAKSMATASLTATESSDTLVAASSAPATGTLTATEAPDTVVATAAAAVAGTLTKTETGDTISATAAVAIAATLTKTETGDTISAGAAAAVAGTLTATEAADTLAATGGTPQANASLDVTEAPDTSTATAAVSIAATLALAEAADTIAASGTVAAGAARWDSAIWDQATWLSGLPIGNLSVEEAPDTLASTGTVSLTGTLTATEQPDTLDAATAVLIAATLAKAEAGDTLAATAAADVAATLTATEASDTLVAAAGAQAGAALTATEANDTLVAAAAASIAGALVATEAPDTLVAQAAASVTATLTVTEARDTIAATGTVASGIIANLDKTEAPDTLAATASNPVVGILTVTEAPDTVVAVGAVSNFANLTQIEAPDTLTATAGAGIAATLTKTEAPDTLAAASAALVGAVLAATEASDTLAAAGTVVSPSYTGMVVEFSAWADANPGAFSVKTEAGRAAFTVRGTGAAADVDFGPVVAPAARVFTGITDLAGPIIVGRTNGVQTDTDTGALGGHFGNYPLFIGGGQELHLYSLIVRGAKTSLTDIEDIERYVGAKTGVGLPGGALPNLWLHVSPNWLMAFAVFMLLTVLLAGCAVAIAIANEGATHVESATTTGSSDRQDRDNAKPAGERPAGGPAQRRPDFANPLRLRNLRPGNQTQRRRRRAHLRPVQHGSHLVR